MTVLDHPIPSGTSAPINAPVKAPVNMWFVGFAAFIVLAMAAPVRSIAIVPAALFMTIIAIDHVWTRIALHRLKLEGTAIETVVGVGDDVAVRLTMSQGVWGTRVLAGAHDAAVMHMQGESDISFRAAQVGIHRAVPVVVRVACLGVANAERTIEVPLARDLHCGPRLDGAVDECRAGAVGGESATRPYVPGDRPNRINWAATARTGDLLVRSAGTDEDELIVMIDATDADAGDLDWLWRPASTIATWWAAGGGSVRLITTEQHHVVRPSNSAVSLVDAPVHDRPELLRRLASVAPGPTVTAHYPDALVFAPPVQP